MPRPTAGDPTRNATLAAALLAAVLFCLLPLAVRGEAARQLDWEDLVPPAPELADPLAELPDEQRYNLELVATYHYLRSLGRVAEGDRVAEAAETYTGRLSRQGVDVDGYVVRYKRYLAAVEAQDQTLNEALNGSLVRIPGYLLPLEFDGTGVSEFLLVPYVGACIHVPPPPPNQMILVKLPQAFASSGLYTPVWVEGRIHAKHSRTALSLVDGQAQVGVGYSIEDGRVALYED